MVSKYATFYASYQQCYVDNVGFVHFPCSGFRCSDFVTAFTWPDFPRGVFYGGGPQFSMEGYKKAPDFAGAIIQPDPSAFAGFLVPKFHNRPADKFGFNAPALVCRQF